MLVRYVHTTTFILTVIGLIGCAGRFDYNLLLALGWIYLSDKHPSFAKSFAVIHPYIQFYVLLLGSILVDFITIFASKDLIDRFTFMFVPILEIITKASIFSFSIYYARRGLQINKDEEH